jgi:hypothetical protein
MAEEYGEEYEEPDINAELASIMALALKENEEESPEHSKIDNKFERKN